MTLFPPPYDQRIQTDVSALFKRVATLEQQMVQATSNVATADAGPTPAVNNLLAWNFDPTAAANANAPGSGTIYLSAIQIVTAITVANIHFTFTQSGGTYTTGCFVGLYDSSGTRVAVSADQVGTWATLGNQKIAMAASYAAPVGTYYVAYLANGSVLANVGTGPAVKSVNAGFTTSPGRFFIKTGANTSLPASLTLSALTLDNTLPAWHGLS